MNAFSDIVIKRFDANKGSRDQIKTRIVYAPKQRVLLDLLDKDQNLQLPVISVSIGGITRDDSRVFNKILGTYHTPIGSTASVHEKGVMPVNITYNISVMTRYQQDMDQILSHLLPYINPYFVISWRTPSRPDHEIRSKVMWDGSVNVQYPVDQNATQVARVVADLSFVFQGWLFQPLESIENIYTFNTTLYNATNSSLETLENYTDLKALSAEIDTMYVDRLVYSAVPPKPKFVNPVFTMLSAEQQFDVWGMGFDSITNVYLSGVPVSSISTSQDPFGGLSALSAVNPSFFGVKLLTSVWSFERYGSSMTFKAPVMGVPGRIDIILENVKGYGKLTDNVVYNTFNPYPSSSAMYEAWNYPQLPYLSGVQVF